MKFIRLSLFLIGLLAIHITIEAQSGVYRTQYSADGLYLRIEILDDDLAHFELSTEETSDAIILTSPMVAKRDYTGATSLEFPSEGEILTVEMRLRVDMETLCVTIADRTQNPEIVLSSICPLINEDDDLSGFNFTRENTTDVYGLGEQFRQRYSTDGNWIDSRRWMPSPYGNTLAPFNGGNVANAQFPIVYAIGEHSENYALFADHVYQQLWNFRDTTFSMNTSRPPIRWYVMTGDNLIDLRSDYMELTGRAPVPPRQMFGLWVSEYGYDNWGELNGVLDSMLAEDFPLDGFVLDLQWFGGIGTNSQMGSLSWDEDNFPDANGFIAQLRDDYGIGIMTIEEPYVSQTSEGYEEAVSANVLVRECSSCPPIEMNEWWGQGSMVDWSNPEASAWWHDERRQHLIDAGVIGHWTHLGEPENFLEYAWYYGIEQDNFRHNHASIHNIYNLLWSQSIAEGYIRNDIERRPFIMSRSGTSGSQRSGVAMWSGDIAANLPGLTEQMNVQMQMAMSGIDYFGSDIGGFFRQSSDPVLGQDGIYSLWLANSVLLDVPLRPHAMNISNIYQTAPSLIGDIASNLANVRLRYEISPYLYSLAHRAYRTGEAVYPPPVYHFQDDLAVRAIGSQKMIGDAMMMATLTDYSPETTDVYLPAGGWFNYHSGEFIDSGGETVEIESLPDGILRAPLLVRDGAILPLMPVDANTGNLLGQQRDGNNNHSLIFAIYHASQDGSFTLYEDDGETIAYQTGAVRETHITHTRENGNMTIAISPAEGTFEGAPDSREIEIRLISPSIQVSQIMLNDEELSEIAASDESPGWMQAESGMVVIQTGETSIDNELIVSIHGS